MKKILVPLLIASVVCGMLCGCANRFKLQSIPEKLTIEPASLSEDPNDLLNPEQVYPLWAALPEESLYVYAIDPTLTNGALVKFDGVIQYFSWLFVSVNAEPELFVHDYNGDGKKDVAISFLSSVGQTNHNEELHVLMRTEDGFEDYVYIKTKVVSDVKTHLSMMKKAEGQYSIYLDGKENPVQLDRTGDLIGLYYDDVQNYTLGETITIEIKPGIVFSDQQYPDYSVFDYYADVVFENGTCGQANGRIEIK